MAVAELTAYLGKDISLVPPEKKEQQLSINEESEVLLADKDGSNQQRFIIQEFDGWYTIQNKQTKKYLSTKTQP